MGKMFRACKGLVEQVSGANESPDQSYLSWITSPTSRRPLILSQSQSEPSTVIFVHPVGSAGLCHWEWSSCTFCSGCVMLWSAFPCGFHKWTKAVVTVGWQLLLQYEQDAPPTGTLTASLIEAWSKMRMFCLYTKYFTTIALAISCIFSMLHSCYCSSKCVLH